MFPGGSADACPLGKRISRCHRAGRAQLPSMRATCVLAAMVAVACGGKKSAEESVVPPHTQTQLVISMQGAGMVRGDGYECRGSCTKIFPLGMQVRIEAVPDAGAVFGGWTGACSGTAPCDVKMDDDRSVTARFDAAPPPPPGKATLTVLLDGHGSVRSSPAGIDCGGICTAAFDM